MRGHRQSEIDANRGGCISGLRASLSWGGSGRSICVSVMRLTLVVCLLVSLAGCARENPAIRADPCPGVEPQSLGAPYRLRVEPASFDVDAGPVWFRSEGFVVPEFFPQPYYAVLFVGRAPLEAGVTAEDISQIADETVQVVGDDWTPLNLDQGSYWLLAGATATEVSVVACQGGGVTVTERVGP